MRIPLLILFIFVMNMAFVNNSWAQASFSADHAQNASMDMSEPPFWMSSYDEFDDLQKSQKDFYVEALVVKLKQVPALKDLDKARMTEARQWYGTWNEIRKKLYIYCRDKQSAATCEQIADLRLQTLDMFANQKFENREADALLVSK